MPGRSGTCAGSTVRSRSASCATYRERLAVADDPRSLGAPLRRTAGTGAAPLWRYRVGGWRIVARIEDDVLRVLVLRIAHRREVYR